MFDHIAYHINIFPFFNLYPGDGGCAAYDGSFAT